LHANKKTAEQEELKLFMLKFITRITRINV